MTYHIEFCKKKHMAVCDTCGWASNPSISAGLAGSLYDIHNQEVHNMHHHTLVDDFGRKTVFTGVQLVDDHTDTEEANKPNWREATVWRTEGGNYIVRRTTRYRIVHSTENCAKADGYELVPSTEDDTYPCQHCNKMGLPGFGQQDRVSVDTYSTPQGLIESFQVDGRYSRFAGAILSELAKVDEDIDKAWSVVHVA